MICSIGINSHVQLIIGRDFERMYAWIEHVNLHVGHVVLMWRTVVSYNKYYKLSGDR